MKKIIINQLRAIPRTVYIITAMVIAVIVALLILTPEGVCVNGLNSLSEATAYALSMPELPPMDNTNLVRPEYNKFYRSTASGYFTNKWHAIACCLNIHTRFNWPSLYFKSLLEVSLTRLKSYKIEKNIVYKMAPSATARYVIFGDLYGAYHSLVRDLNKLKELKILDDSLKIVSPETYIVFMGSAISRSPYGMETLGLILRLMEMNLDAVIYMRGNHEDNKYWEAFGLKEQIEYKYRQDADYVVANINNVFMRLPLGLYLALPGHPEHFVKISHLSGEESAKLKEDNYAHFLETKQSSLLDKYEISQSITHNNKIIIDAAFHSEKKRQTFQKTTGLRQLPADGGVTTWTLMSAPTLVMQKGFDFTHDAFAIIQLAPLKEDWIITEYSQDSLKKDGFKTTAYQFFTGAHADKKQPIPEGKKTLEVQHLPTTPLVDIITPEALRIAINSNFIQALIGHRRKSAAIVPAASSGIPVVAPQQPFDDVQAKPVAKSVPSTLPEAPLPIAVNRGGEMSITVGAPVQDEMTHTITLPLMVTIKDKSKPRPLHPSAPVGDQNDHEDVPLVRIDG